MRIEESLAVRRILESSEIFSSREFTHAINLGSGDVHRLSTRKPWVDQNVFDPIRKVGLKVVNVDFIAFPGVDIVADFSQVHALSFAQEMTGKRLFVLANVVEHVPHSVRENLFRLLHQEMREGDALLMTAPLAYPYHPDPIDTLYRVSPEALQKNIGLTWLAGESVECGSFRSDLAGMSKWKRIRKMIKPLLPLMPPKKYFAAVHQLKFLFRPYVISIVLGQKLVGRERQLSP